MICPNCGAQLPDTVIMCYSCRVYFNHENHVYYENKTDYLEQTGSSIPGQQDDKTLYYAGMIIGIISGALILLSAFVPYITASVFGISKSITLSEASSYYTIEVIILCVGLILDAIFQHGKSNIAVGIIILFFSVYRYNQYLDFVNEGELNGLAHLSAGYYMIVISGICAIVSGVLLVVYDKQ